jgi:two-component system, sensor histidine kinase and response regulator
MRIIEAAISGVFYGRYHGMQRPARIVIVDYDPPLVELVRDILNEEGYEVMTVVDRPPVACYRIITDEPPDLMLIDMSMHARKLGMDLVSFIRNNPPTQTMPIVVYTTTPQFLQELVPQLEAYGCWIVEKPFDLEQLLTTICAAFG